MQFTMQYENKAQFNKDFSQNWHFFTLGKSKLFNSESEHQALMNDKLLSYENWRLIWPQTHLCKCLLPLVKEKKNKGSWRSTLWREKRCHDVCILQHSEGVLSTKENTKETYFTCLSALSNTLYNKGGIKFSTAFPTSLRNKSLAGRQLSLRTKRKD